MTTKHTTKKALLSSVLSLFLCFVMLLGTTFAWFTDSVTSANNIIQSGNLDVEMYWADGAKAVPTTAAGWTDASTTAIFNYDKWEPGYVQVRHIKIANEGSLALKYKVNIVANEEVSDLSDVIDVYYVDPAVQIVTRDQLTADKKLGTLTQVLEKLGETGNGTLEAGKADTITIAFMMQTTAGNEYMKKSIGSSFSVQILATQLNSENDSYGSDYDVDSAYPVFSNKVTVEENAAAPVVFETETLKVTAPTELIGTLFEKNIEEFYINHTEPRVDDNSVVFDTVEFYDQDGNVIDLEALGNTTSINVTLDVSEKFVEGDSVKVFHNGELVAAVTVGAGGIITYTTTHFCEVVVAENPLVTITRNGVVYGFSSIQNAIDSAVDGDELVLRASYNTSDEPLTETITVDKDITLVNGGMYLVSAAPATFTVVEGGKLTVTEGSFTIKNTSANGAAVLLDGGEFDMQGGSFDAHTAVRTTAGKSSVATLTAGWSNRVTVGFECNGNDTVNVLGGTLISSKQSIIAKSEFTLNMSGGTLSGKSVSTYSASVLCNGATTINMTGGKIESTNGESIAITVYNNSEINISGDAVVAGAFSAVNTGGGMRPNGDNNVVNISGNAKISASGAGNSFGIGYAVYACSSNTHITVSGNAQVTGTSYGVYAGQGGSSITVKDSAHIKATTGKNSGYGVGALTITITGGTIEAKEYAVISNFTEGGTVIIDNSETGNAITLTGGILGVLVSDSTDYTVAGNPVIKP